MDLCSTFHVFGIILYFCIPIYGTVFEFIRLSVSNNILTHLFVNIYQYSGSYTYT